MMSEYSLCLTDMDTCHFHASDRLEGVRTETT